MKQVIDIFPEKNFIDIKNCSNSGLYIKLHSGEWYILTKHQRYVWLPLNKTINIFGFNEYESLRHALKCGIKEAEVFHFETFLEFCKYYQNWLNKINKSITKICEDCDDAIT